jgi:malonyl-CoA/methylmalonyl-CoA synthetase
LIEPTATRIHALFDAALQRDPQRVLLQLSDDAGQPVSLSHADLAVLVDLAQAELLASGVLPGDRVLIVAENCPEHVALILACSRVGAWSCGVNARMAPGEVAAFMQRADARLACFTAAASPAAAAHALRFAAQPSRLPGVLFSAPRPEAMPEPLPLRDSVAAIIFTSGTTGAPKGVLMTHDGVLHFARVSAASRALGPADKVYAYLPMTHIFGLGTVLMASLQAGAALLMRPAFDPVDLLDALARRGVSQLQGPPTLFARLLAHLAQHGIQRVNAPDLRYLYTGAGPLDIVLKRQVEAVFGLPLHHGYGLSEYAGSVHVGRLGEWRDDTAAGYRVDGAELRIVDPASGQDLPTGQRGEIWLRGRGLMPGYFRDTAATAAVMREGGWYASGDLGELGADGALFVVGRLKEMIIRSGFNVYPGEVEAVLQAFPAVARAAVVGQADAEGNEAVLAFVELRHGAVLDDAALQAHLREHLAPYKRPARITVVPEMPVTHSGKLLKRSLPDLYPAG